MKSRNELIDELDDIENLLPALWHGLGELEYREATEEDPKQLEIAQYCAKGKREQIESYTERLRVLRREIATTEIYDATLEQLIAQIARNLETIEAPFEKEAETDIAYIQKNGENISKKLSDFALIVAREQAEQNARQIFRDKIQKQHDEQQAIIDKLHKQIHRLSKSQ